MDDFANASMTEIWEKIVLLGTYFSAVWNYQITVVDGGGVTVGKIVFAIFLIVVGYNLSRKISKQIRRKVLGRFSLTLGALSAIEAMVFYVLFVFFVLFALKLASVPLTIFTVIGGAFAIGLGFGSQNIMNNFISGIIMLIEQPIKVGDFVEVDGVVGTVANIGPRSTVIRTTGNADIILPNSSFLEKNVVNLTHSDNKLRLQVAVGVAYGSNTRKVEELLLAAAKSHKAILSDPAPFVWFVEFGDNSLNFELHFWAIIKTLSSKSTMQSEIRYEVDRLFHDNGISIAFPQRDIHLDTLRPLEVKVIGKS